MQRRRIRRACGDVGSCADAAPRRRAQHPRAPPPRRPAAGTAPRNRPHLVELAVAVEDDVAAGRDRRARALGDRAGQRSHRNIVAHQQPVEIRSSPQITSRTIVTEVVAGATGSMAVNTTWAVIPSGRSASGRNAAKSVASSVARSVSTTGSVAVAVGGGAAVAGDVLEHRQHAAGRAGLRRPRARSPRPCRRVAVGAVADHRVGAGDRHVGERQAIDVDADRREIGGDQARAETGRLQSAAAASRS